MYSDQKEFVELVNKHFIDIEYTNDYTFHTNNSVMLIEFIQFCANNPEMRFMQALRAFLGWPAVLVGEFSLHPETLESYYTNLHDTYYWEDIKPYI